MAALFNIAKKRFKNELKLLNNPDKDPPFFATAFPSDKPGEELVWYFLIVGDDDSDYSRGEYIGKIVHSDKYPTEPPDYYMLTPNGRYEIDRKICLSNSSYHRGEWTTSWNIITILIAYNSIWYDDKESGISHITHTPPAERRKCAGESVAFNKRKYSDVYSKFNRTFLSGSAPKIIREELKPAAEEAKSEEEVVVAVAAAAAEIIEDKKELLQEIDDVIKADEDTAIIKKEKKAKKASKKSTDTDEDAEIIDEKKKVKKVKKAKAVTAATADEPDDDDNVKLSEKKVKKNKKESKKKAIIEDDEVTNDSNTKSDDEY
jgi:ubiquitin-protein ligase